VHKQPIPCTVAKSLMSASHLLDDPVHEWLHQ
jgi:hypothetical protein